MNMATNAFGFFCNQWFQELSQRTFDCQTTACAKMAHVCTFEQLDPVEIMRPVARI